jgi:DNA transformation protein
MTISGEFLNYVLEQLSALRGVTSRRMFGAVGLYCEGVIFGLIASDVLYFKVGDGNRADYESRGMRPFRPFADKPGVSMSYFEVPAEVLEDREECAVWARRGVAVASVTRKTSRGRRGQ